MGKNGSIEGISLWYLNQNDDVDIEPHIIPFGRMFVKHIYHLTTALVLVRRSQ